MNYRLLIIAVLLSVVGCIKDPDVGIYAGGEEQSLTLSVESFTDEMVSSTRSVAGDVEIKRGYLFFFNSTTGAYKGYKSVADLNISQSGSKVSFEIGSEFSIKDRIIAVFNHDEGALQTSDFSGVTAANIGSYFTLSDEYLAEVEADANAKSYSLGIPMYVNDFTDSDRAVREVYRSIARMELFIKSGLTIEHGSHDHSIGAADLEFAVVNAASQGAVAKGSSYEYAAEAGFDVSNFDGKFPHRLTSYDAKPADTDNKVYLYSFPYATRSIVGGKLSADGYSSERFAIILRHKDIDISTGVEIDESRYYKLNLLDKATSKYFDIEDNHSYRVVIKAVNSRGYATLKEAYDMPPSNIEYEIYDDKGGLTYSNGQYAISMDEILSYDEVLVYSSNETTLEFNNIRYVLPAGGQMDSADFETNEVKFGILDNEDNLIVKTTSDFAFGDDGKSTLSSKGQSIKVTLSGEGECSIQLLIKLGNLEMGREEIVIRKVAGNGNGDGSFDAHPNHEEIAGQLFVEGSWRSDDIDFGARASSALYDDIGDGGTVIYMGENATPTGYRTMDGYVSGQHSVNSYPVYSPKTRKGYYAYKDAKGETRKVMIQLNQLAPFYLGHFGNTASDSESSHHYDGLICEKIEEIKIPGTSWSKEEKTNGVMRWSEAAICYYGSSNIYGDTPSGKRYKNLVDGLAINNYIIDNNRSAGSLPLASLYCYMKNDVNGNGVIDSDEPIRWYLPAQNQLMAMWINKNVFNTDIELYSLQDDMGDARTYYWSCSEVDPNNMDNPMNYNQHAISMNMLEGETMLREPKSEDYGKNHIRCVRGVD